MTDQKLIIATTLKNRIFQLETFIKYLNSLLTNETIKIKIEVQALLHKQCSFLNVNDNYGGNEIKYIETEDAQVIIHAINDQILKLQEEFNRL